MVDLHFFFMINLEILACLSGERSLTFASVWNSSSEESSPPVSVSTSFSVWNSSLSELVMERTLCNVWNWSSDSESDTTVLSVTDSKGREKSDLVLNSIKKIRC